MPCIAPQGELGKLGNSVNRTHILPLPSFPGIIFQRRLPPTFPLAGQLLLGRIRNGTTREDRLAPAPSYIRQTSPLVSPKTQWQCLTIEGVGWGSSADWPCRATSASSDSSGALPHASRKTALLPPCQMNDACRKFLYAPGTPVLPLSADAGLAGPGKHRD